MRRKKNQIPFSLFAFQDAIASVCGFVVLIALILALELTNQIVEEAARPVPSPAALTDLTNEISTLKSNIAALKQTSELWDEMSRQASRSHFSPENAEAELLQAERRLAESLTENERLQALIANENETKTSRDELLREMEKQKAELADLDAQIANLRREQSLTRSASIYYASTNDVRETPWLVDVAERRIIVRSLKSEGAAPKRPLEFSGRAAPSGFLSWARQRDKNAEYFVLVVRPSGVASYDNIRNSLEKNGFKIGIDLVGETSTVEID